MAVPVPCGRPRGVPVQPRSRFRPSRPGLRRSHPPRPVAYRQGRAGMSVELKKIFFLSCYFLKVHLHYFSKIKVKKSHKMVGFKVFLSIFA